MVLTHCPVVADNSNPASHLHCGAATAPTAAVFTHVEWLSSQGSSPPTTAGITHGEPIAI